MAAKMSLSLAGLTVVCVLFLTKNVSGSGKLEMKLKSYRSDGKGSNGHCCDGKLIFCLTECDHKFRICVDKEHGSDSMSDCMYKPVYQTDPTMDQRNVYFGDMIGSKKNYFSFAFDTWKGAAKVKIAVEDYDDIFNHDHVETLIKTVRRTPGRPAHYTTELLQDRTSLEVEIRLSCDQDFYSNNCGVFCKAQNDPENGFYTCDQHTGAKICKPGWMGPNCKTDVNECEQNICQNNGTCNNTFNGYNCDCLEDYKGYNCEISPVCISHPCQNNGNCTETPMLSRNCSCQIGYSGESCEVKVDPCTCSPCKNGATCSSDDSGNYTCTCTSAWMGRSCEIKVPPVTPITFFGDTTRITLLGRINDDNRQELVDGLRNLSRDLGGVQGRILIQIETTTFPIKQNEIVTEVEFIVAVNHGQTVISNDQIDAIFQNNKPEVINPYLPLPLYYSSGGVANPSAVVGMKENDSWIQNYWYVVFLIALICVLAFLAFGFLFIRRRRKKETEKTEILDDSDVHPVNMAFENVLYSENNRANRDREQTSTSAERGEEIDATRVALPEEGAVGGTTLPDNAYDTPKPANHHYQDIDEIKKQKQNGAGPYLDMNGTARRSVDNTYADFDKLSVSMRQIAEENHYQDLDKIKEELESLSSDSEDEIDAIKQSNA